MDPAARAQSTLPPQRHLAMLIAAVGAGVCVGIGSGALQAAGVALLGLQSLAAGALLGVLLIGAATCIAAGRLRWPVALLAAGMAVVAQHLWLYEAAMAARQKAVASQPAVELFRPGWSDQSFFEYMQAEATPQAMGLWSLDACLLALAAVVIVEISAKRRVANGEWAA